MLLGSISKPECEKEQKGRGDTFKHLKSEFTEVKRSRIDITGQKKWVSAL